VRCGVLRRGGVGWPEAAVVAWAGMRGGDSLAAALALPTVTLAGAAFPNRGVLIFLTFSTILATLIVQGLTLPLLIRRLRIGTQLADDPEEVLAERRLAEVALARLDTLARELQAPAAAVERARAELLHELRDLHGSDPHHQWEDATTRRLQLELVDTQRQEAVRLRDRSIIGDDVLYHLLRALDLEEARLDEPE